MIGEIVCKECDLVVEDRIIDQTSEWRNFASEASSHSSDPNRVGGPLDENRDDFGMNLKIISKGVTTHSSLMKTSQKSSQDSSDKSLDRGYNVIRDFGERLNLQGSVVEESKNLFRSIARKKKLKGRNLESVAAAVIYVCTKKSENPRSLRGISRKREHAG